MKLCIADPPYLGLANMFYGDSTAYESNHNWGGTRQRPDHHPDAAEWDNPETHRLMVERLIAEYDGWAIAMVPSSLWHYMQWVPQATRVAVWHDPAVMPGGTHPRRRWEPVMVYVPKCRRNIQQIPPMRRVGDVMTCRHPSGGAFAGRKPAAWTRWILNMLGYNHETDTVDDLFPGSGAVSAEVAQLVIE
jgi:hypothetical protein